MRILFQLFFKTW